ncbi:MAG: LPP20 family lipoprotein [Proteobacteria bacterium]|nr:LPP20 family lipoprotein [Pseudomonadota bacterium]
MKKLSLCILVLSIFMVPFYGFSAESYEMIQNLEHGHINWTTGVVVAKGIGAPPDNSKAARPMAIQAAKLVAYRNLLELIKYVRIDSTTTVENFIVKSDVITSRVEGIIHNAQVIKTDYMSDGTVEVIVQMDMRGSFSQLLLPQEIQQVESIKPIPQDNMATPPSGVYTGLIVDGRGLKVKPAMSPRILDENGQEVYGSAYVSREFAVQQGMSGYAKDIDAAAKNERVTDRPLLVKGLKTSGAGNSDIVISNADSAVIRNTSENLSFLKQCRVMIVVD